jgi:DegV family protein with EDD domain
MPGICVVTDSCADFVNSNFVSQNPVTVVPNIVAIAGQDYCEGVDLTHEEALQRISRASTPPQVKSPTVANYIETFDRLLRQYNQIVSIHTSREIFSNWHNADAAARQMMGHGEIAIIDSRTISVAQGFLVRVAVNAIQEQQPLDDIVRLVRGAIERLHTVMFTSEVSHLYRNRIMSESHTILGKMLAIKPLLFIEDGLILPMEKVKTRNQAVEGLVAYAEEFTHIERAAILQSKMYMAEQSRNLQDRLKMVFPKQHFPHTVYSPSLGALIGPKATGVVILESEMEDFMDDYDDDLY